MTLLAFLVGMCTGACIAAIVAVFCFFWFKTMEIERTIVDLHDELREDYNTWCKENSKGGS